MNNSFRLAVMMGIPIEIHISWLLIFFLFSISLARGYFPGTISGLTDGAYWAAGVLTTLVVFASVLTHEFGHSLVAIREGIPIKKIVLFIFGGVAQMESEPSSPAAEFRITAAGPLTSLALAVLFGLLYLLALPAETLLSESVFIVAQLNLVMAVFNLIPAFPLDGGRLFRSLTWFFTRSMLKATRVAVGLSSLLSFAAMAFGFMLTFFQGNLQGLWIIFLGWMIYQAGQSSYSQLVFKETFSGVTVSELMSRELETVSPDLTLDQLAEHFLQHKYGAFPVVYGSTTHGIVSLQDLKTVPREQWPETRVSRVMTPLREALIIKPESDAAGVMLKMATQNLGRALVMAEGNLVGLLSRTDMMRFIQMHMVLGEE